ncbi:C25 family cysteine peptidase [Desulfovibrio gilichinskyi]|uniref:Sporulation related domain-containing protein n=1 Tax=Desulfovibrio gilichinskyi TaxID=1519643 RepID=A0A1X7EIE3_9BACT|nr:C25 family cysteine peptidase [Desulfovibrio gilichinskyi]SMF34472.1 Sporulation related domain-containing protein [Desulfovibrio gilichinskyi]
MIRKLKWISLPLLFILASFLLGGCKLRTFQQNVQVAPAVQVLPVKISTAQMTEQKKSIIVFTDEFKQAAHFFSYLHREYEGVDSVLIKIGTMNGTEESRSAVSRDIQSKISELNKGDGIMAVLILGNKSIIPALKFKAGDGGTIYSSDYGYGGIADSPENVLPVGRIPAGNNSEAMIVAQKYERWYQDRAFRPAWPVSFIGGEGFSKNDLSDPELLFFSLQEEGMAGPEAIRYLGGAGGCLPERLRQSFADDDVSVQWLALKSVSDGFRVGNGTLLTSDILNLDYKPGLPIVLNPSCEVALGNSTVTPAEAMILSKGAGLAVMGGCGDGGKVTAELDDGCISRVYLDGTSRLLVEFHKAYFSGKYRIAEALAEARAQFVQNSRRGDDLGPIYDMIFYGDPVMSLPLPVRTESPAYTGLKPITKPEFPKGVAVFYANATISFAMEEGGIYPGVQVNVVDRKTGKTVSSMKVLEDDVFNFSSDSEGSYLIYSRPLDGPIAWQFFDIYKNKNSPVDLVHSDTRKTSIKVDPVVKSGIEPILYSVQVSSNRRESSALKVRKSLTKKGYSSAYVVTVPSSHNRPWYCVRFGEFNSWADAVEASAKYEKNEQADVKIVRCRKGS